MPARWSKALVVIVATVALIAGAGVIFWNLAFQTVTVRYRVTVEVNVGETVRMGSGVIEVSINRQPPFGEVPPFELRVRGEAVHVDIGDGKILFAVVKGGRSYEEMSFPQEAVARAFGLPFDGKHFSRLPGLKGKRELQPRFYPAFATFADLRIPASVRQVRAGDFSQVFGDGVSLRGVSVEIVSEPASAGIEKVLPWLSAADRMPIEMRNAPFDTFSFKRNF